LAVAGATYCYSVVAVGLGGPSKAAISGPEQFKPASPPPTTTVPTTPPPSASSSGILQSSIARLAAAVGSGIVVFGLLVLLATRLLPRIRRDSWEYRKGPLGAVRGTLQRYDTGALVIPMVILVIGLVLLAAAAVTL
jgi:hypothetical protein